MKISFHFPLLLLALALAAVPAAQLCADTVTTRDGQVFEGEILDEDGETVRVRTTRGTVTLKKANVTNIERKVGPFQIARSRREKLASDDAQARWDLVTYCLENDLRQDAEELLHEIRSMASPFYTQATRKLADLTAERSAKKAVLLLDDLVAKTGDLEAKVKAKELKRTLDQQRRSAVQEAEAAAQRRDWIDCIKSFRHAYTLSYPARKGEKTELSQEEVLASLADVRKQRENLVRERRTKRPASGDGETAKAVDYACKTCDQHTGWGACSTCKGSGKVSKQLPPVITSRGMRPGKFVNVACPTCKGGRKSRCAICYGTGVEPSKLTSRARYALKSIADYAWTRKHLDAYKAMQWSLNYAMQRKLKLPDGFVPDYPAGGSLRKMLPALPVDPDWTKSGAYGAFKKEFAKQPPQVIGVFLVQYAMEASQSTVVVAGDAGDAGAGDAPELDPDEKLDLASLQRKAPVASATEISALPEDWAGRWVLVDSVFQTLDESEKGCAMLRIGTPHAHNLNPYLFDSDAQRAHGIAAKDDHAPAHIKVLAAQYPYKGLTQHAAGLKAGDHLRLFGRVIYRKTLDPETSLEVWGFDVHADAETQRQLGLVRRSVTFHFQDTSLPEATELLAQLTGTPIKVEAKAAAELTVSARATGQPLAQALEAMLKPAGLVWVFDGPAGGVKVVPQASPEQATRKEQVLKFLK